MKNKLCVGILRETYAEEHRAPLTPDDVNWLVRQGVAVEVESSPARIFPDRLYKKNGAKIVDRFCEASLLLGVKQPKVENIYANKIYMIFSHTAKGQAQNMPLLKEIIKKRNILIDYEKITDSQGKRLVYFGRFAGICGVVDSLHYLGKKLRWQGHQNPFESLKAAHEYDSLTEVKRAIIRLGDQIKQKGFEKALFPFIIGITGHGNVSRGVQEILDLLGPKELSPKDMKQFVCHPKGFSNTIYRIVFSRQEKIRLKKGGKFNLQEYLKNPERFKSNLDKYLPYLNLFIHASYWESCYPRMVTKNMIHELWQKEPFRLELIGDISCDINGGIELTYKVTTPDNPVFTYDPKNKVFIDGYRSSGITILARGNLSSELPEDASIEFSALIRSYVYQIATHVMPQEVNRAIIVKNGSLAKDFKYLETYLNRKE